jgi:magnesium chelatase accessory protein
LKSAPDPIKRVPVDWPHREHSRSVAAGALDWHVQVAGRGPTVLLLHGTGSSAHSWADLLPQLAQVSTVVAPDLPGHGFTVGAATASLTLPRIAADLDALLAALKVDPPALVAGHSAGAALAIRWALGTAQPPRGIIGFNPSLITPPAAYTNLLGPLIAPVATSSLVASALASISARTRVVDRLLASTRSSVPAAQRTRYATLFRDPEHVRGAIGLMATADLPALLESGRTLGVPTTFVIGVDDPWVRAAPLRRVLADSFPAAKVLEWSGGHVLHEAQPGQAAQLIIAELARIAGGGARLQTERC